MKKWNETLCTNQKDSYERTSHAFYFENLPEDAPVSLPLLPEAWRSLSQQHCACGACVSTRVSSFVVGWKWSAGRQVQFPASPNTHPSPLGPERWRRPLQLKSAWRLQKITPTMHVELQWRILCRKIQLYLSFYVAFLSLIYKLYGISKVGKRKPADLVYI